MPYLDSIQSVKDSAISFADTININDSILLKDSLAKIDAPVVAVLKVYNGIPHPSLPNTEIWVFAALILMFLLLVFTFNRSSGWMSDTLRYFFKKKDRSSYFSKATISDFYSKSAILLFSIGVFSLYTYLQMFKPESGFHFNSYIYFFMVFLAFYLIKYLIIIILGYVFIEPANLKTATEYYYNILSFLAISLFPLLFCQIYIHEDYIYIIQTIGLILSGIALIVLIIKLFQIFFNKIVVSFYILLYLCTLEILPLFLLYAVVRMLV
jgi:hypothetical protein